MCALPEKRAIRQYVDLIGKVLEENPETFRWGRGIKCQLMTSQECERKGMGKTNLGLLRISRGGPNFLHFCGRHMNYNEEYRVELGKKTKTVIKKEHQQQFLK